MNPSLQSLYTFLRFAVCCLLSLPVSAQPSGIDLTPYQQVRYVSVSTGSDSTGDGSQSSPWKTLPHALDQITDAASTKTYAVLIASGTYTATGTYTAFTMKEYVHLYGGFDPADWSRNSAAGKTVLDGEHKRRVITIASNCTLDGFIITRGLSSSGGGVFGSQISAGVISNCTICENKATSTGGGLLFGYQSAISVNGCIVRDNQSQGDGGGVSLSSVASVAMKNCIIFGNTAANYGAGVHFVAASPNLVNCTIVDNHGSGAGCEGTSKPKFYNCILWNRGAELVGGAPIAFYCCVQGGWAGTGNINALPLFVDPDHHDYHLRNGSPCIDRGNKFVSTTTDFEGTPRPSGENAEIGAFECPATYTQGAVEVYSPMRRYVRWDAPEGGDGLSWSTAHRSITEALALVGGDDDIWVAGGTYHEAIILEPSMALYGGFAGTETSLFERSWAAHPTIIDATGKNTSAAVGAPQARLDAVHLTGGSSSYGGGLNCTGGPTYLNNCVIRGNSALYFAGGIYCEWSSSVLTNCVIVSNTSYQYGGAALVTLNSSPILTHCTIAGNAGGQGDALRFLNDSHPRITNCILWNLGTEIYADGIDLSYSCVQGGWEGKGNIDSPPDFVDFSGGDYHLFDGSPCISGATTTAGLATDIEGNPRAQGPAPDMGAYEAPASFSQGPLGYDPTRYYVKADAGQAGDGHSWELAFNSITAAMRAAWPGDEVWVAGGYYNEGVVLESGVSVYGGFVGNESSLPERNWKANPSTIDASGLSRQAVYAADGTILDGFRITGGTASGVYSPRSSIRIANCAIQGNTANSPNLGGGLSIDNASLEVVACTIANNTSSFLAGGVYCMNCSAVISGCSITNNNGPGSGGGIYSHGSVLVVTTCWISDNRSGTANGGLSLVDSGSGGGGIHGRYSTLSLSECSFAGNYSSMEGGGLNCYKSDADIESCTFSENRARNGGGGGMNLTESTCSLSHCLFDGNTVSTAMYNGGGFFGSSSTVQIYSSSFIQNVRDGAAFVACAAVVRGCTFSGNSGNGVYCYNSPGPSLTHCVISNTSGRGLYCRKCPAVVSSCTLTDNINSNASSSSSSGGAVYCEGLPSLTLQNSLLSGNSAAHGGGIYSAGSSPMLLSCRLLNNSVSQRGGGLYFSSPCESAIRNCMICDNTAREGGGLYCDPSSATVLLNCTISGNRATGGSMYAGGINNLGTALSVTNCILWNDLPKEVYRISGTSNPFQYSNIQGGITGTGNIDEDPLFVNPMLGDFHLQAESPCIEAGIGPDMNSLVPLLDIDGEARTGAACDMGADEVPEPTWIRDWLNY